MASYLLRPAAILLLIAVAVTAETSRAQDFVGIRSKAQDSILFVQRVVRNRDGTGEHVADSATGFVVACRGYFLTAAHVVQSVTSSQEQAYYASPGPRDSQRFQLDLVKSDADLDVALFQLPPSRPWAPLAIASSSGVPDDAKVLVLGYGTGSDLGSSQGTIRNHFGPGGRLNTQVPFNHGDSGAPAFDISGRVIGMASSGLALANSFTVITPSDYFQPLLSLTGVNNAQNCTPPPTAVSASTKSFQFSFTAEPDQSREFSQTFCVDEGVSVRRVEVHTDSINGEGTHIISSLKDTDRPNCVTLRVFVRGNGVDRIGGIIVNYRGRGWISGALNVSYG